MAPMRVHSADVTAGAVAGAPVGVIACGPGRQALDSGCQVALAHHVLHDAKRHADSGASKAQMPVDALREVSRDERPQKGAEVDAHVEDGEPGVPAAVAFPVERADDGADVGLQESRSDDDQPQPEIEEGEGLEGERDVAKGDDDPAHQHASIGAQKAIGDQAAQNRGAPDAARVGAVDGRRVGNREPQAAGGHRRGHVEDEEGAHAVVAEALPHLGEKEGREPARVPGPSGVSSGNGVGDDMRELYHGHAGHGSSHPTDTACLPSSSPRA